jgi:hypothetical protein
MTVIVKVLEYEIVLPTKNGDSSTCTVGTVASVP